MNCPMTYRSGARKPRRTIPPEIADRAELFDDSAGGLMSTDIITIRADLTLDVVLRYLRRHSKSLQYRQPIVVTDTPIRGLLPIGILLVSDPAISVGR